MFRDFPSWKCPPVEKFQSIDPSGYPWIPFAWKVQPLATFSILAQIPCQLLRKAALLQRKIPPPWFL